MTEIYLARQGRSLVPVNDSDLEQLEKLKHWAIYKAEVTAPRNLKFHRKFFALLNLTFEYYEPSSMVAEVERSVVDRFVRFMVSHGVSQDAAYSIKAGFLNAIENERKDYEGQKNFDVFRSWVIVSAGFYTEVNSPAGPRKIPKSISFASMDDVDFADTYRKVLNVCWSLCLSKIFSNQEELAQALLNFE